MFGTIPVARMVATIPAASAKRLEKNRRLIVEGCYVHWDEPQEIVHDIPDGVSEFEFDFKDESHPDSLPDEDGYIWSDILDGRIRYYFYVEFHNTTDTRKERVKVTPRRVHDGKDQPRESRPEGCDVP